MNFNSASYCVLQATSTRQEASTKARNEAEDTREFYQKLFKRFGLHHPLYSETHPSKPSRLGKILQFPQRHRAAKVMRERRQRRLSYLQKAKSHRRQA